MPVLLDAWKDARLGSSAELWLAGPGGLPAGAALPENARLLGKVSQAGLADVMQKVHALVFPSHFEGLAQVQVEAMACGLPVVGTNASGANEIVENGKTGFVLEAGNTKQLCACLVRLAQDPDLLGRMRESCLNQREELSWHRYGDRWMQLLEERCG